MKYHLLVDFTILKAFAEKAQDKDEIVRLLDDCLTILKTDKPTKEKSDMRPTKST